MALASVGVNTPPRMPPRMMIGVWRRGHGALDDDAEVGADGAAQGHDDGVAPASASIRSRSQPLRSTARRAGISRIKSDVEAQQDEGRPVLQRADGLAPRDDALGLGQVVAVGQHADHDHQAHADEDARHDCRRGRARPPTRP